MDNEYGSIVISADLDPQGFEQGSKGMQKAIQSLHSKVEGLGSTFRKAVAGNTSAMKQFDAKAAGISDTIANVEKQLERLSGKTIETKQYQDLQAELEKVNGKAATLRKKLASTTSENRKNAIKEQLDEAVKKSDELMQKLTELEDSGNHVQLAGDTAEISELRAALDGIKEQLGGMKVSANSAKIALAGMGGAKRVFSSLGRAILNGARHLLSMKKNSNGLGQQIGKLTKGLTSFVGRLKSRVFRSIISGIFSGVKEGINNLAQVVPSLNSSLSTIKSSLTTLKNSFATAFAPIITAVVPYLATLINYCSAAVTWIGKLIAALSGASTFTQATAVQQDYAESLSNTAGAAKDLKRQLAGFDQLNILSENSGGGGGGSSLSPSEMFEEVPIESSIRQWASRLKQAFEEQNYEELGRVLGVGLQTAFSKALDFVSNFDYAAVGIAIASAINGIFQTFDLSTVALGITTFVNGLFSMLGGFVETLDWGGIASNIAGFITTAIRTFDWKKAAESISGFLVGLLGAIGTGLAEIDWEAFGRGIADFILNIDWEGLLSSLGSIFKGIFTGIIETIKGLFSEFNLSDELKGFNQATQEIKDAVDQLDQQLQTKTQGIETQKQYADELIGKLGDLEKQYGPLATENAEYQGIVKELCEIYPDLIKFIDDETGAFKLTNEQLEFQVELLTNKLKIEALQEEYVELEKIRRSAQKNKKATEDYKNEIEELLEAMESHSSWNDLTAEQMERIQEITGILAPTTQTYSYALASLRNEQTQANNAFDSANSALQRVETEMSDLETEMYGLQAASEKSATAVKDSGEEISNGFRTAKEGAEEASDAIGTLAGKIESSMLSMETHITNKLAPAFKVDLPLAVKDGMIDAKDSVSNAVSKMKSSFNSVTEKLKDPIGTVRVNIDDTYETVKESWESIKATEITKTIGGNVTQSFKDAKTSYDSITSETITKTVDGRKTEGFAQAQRDYDSITDRTVNLSFNGNGLSQTARDILGLAKGGVIMSSGKASWWGGVQKYASGTMRAHGSLFVAGEAGPEVVGHVNGRTEILNKSQIASAIYSAVVSAMSFVFSSPIPVEISMVGGTEGMFGNLASLNYQAPAAMTALPYDIQRQIDAINAVSDQIEESTDELARRFLDAITTQTAAIVAAIRAAGRDGAGNADFIDQANRITRMYGTPQLLGG